MHFLGLRQIAIDQNDIFKINLKITLRCILARYISVLYLLFMLPASSGLYKMELLLCLTVTINLNSKWALGGFGTRGF